MKKKILLVVTMAVSLTLGAVVANAGGKEDFDAKCAMCHKDGAKLTKADVAKYEETITNGVAGKGMPSFKDKLDAAAVKAVAEYAKTLAK